MPSNPYKETIGNKVVLPGIDPGVLIIIVVTEPPFIVALIKLYPVTEEVTSPKANGTKFHPDGESNLLTVEVSRDKDPVTVALPVVKYPTFALPDITTKHNSSINASSRVKKILNQKW